MNQSRKDYIRQAVEIELNRARRKHPAKWNSPHEGYAIILEELDEVWEEIKRNDLNAARTEMLQVAATALRFLEEVIDTEAREENEVNHGHPTRIESPL